MADYEEIGQYSKDYQNHYAKEKQESLDHLPEWLKVLRNFYLKHTIKE
jgi:hypothetical protein